jgi:hypothetical protein
MLLPFSYWSYPLEITQSLVPRLRIDAYALRGHNGPMKTLIALLLLIAACLPVKAGERVIMYAMLTEGQLVDLTDGTQWQMDKGDCFPIVAYKESHTKLILQLAGAQFMVPAAKTKVVPDKELAAAVVKYRANVNTYINGYAERWRAQAEATKKPQ